MNAVRTHTLPDVVWTPTPNHGQRNGSIVQRVVLHTWGVHFTDETRELATYRSVIAYFQRPQSQVSAHFVFPGSAEPNEITQMVRYHDFAWTERAYNPTSVEIECADAIWLGDDPDGLEQLAHITGYLLRRFRLPAVWSHDRGFCRHGDLGVAGGDHPSCPTADMTLWKHFCRRVSANHNAGGYRTFWGH